MRKPSLVYYEGDISEDSISAQKYRGRRPPAQPHRKSLRAPLGGAGNQCKIRHHLYISVISESATPMRKF